jgi:hypothetical protein
MVSDHDLAQLRRDFDQRLDALAADLNRLAEAFKKRCEQDIAVCVYKRAALAERIANLEKAAKKLGDQEVLIL